MFNEARMFSESLKTSKNLYSGILKGSRSKQDANYRTSQYEKMFGNYVELKNQLKLYSAYADNDLLANQYFNASVTGLAKSMAGFLTIERSMDQAKMLLYYLDVLGVTDNRKVLPNIGVEDRSEFRNKLTWNAHTVSGTTAYSTALSSKLIPGTVKITLTVGGTAYIITDDKKGALLSPPNVLTAGTVDYTTGDVHFTVRGSWVGNNDTIALVAAADQAGIANINRVKTALNSFEVATAPELLIAETNLATLIGMQKATGVDLASYTTAKLQELYTKLINDEIVSEYLDNYSGNVVSIDTTASGNNFQDYRSTIDKFVGELAAVDVALAAKSYKGTKATAYLAGQNVVIAFKKCKAIGMFREEPQSYVNDLVGYFGDVPVLEHLSVENNACYAIHKTIGGELAPVARGMFLPLTNTPVVGNYQNPTQQANGVFYQQKAQSIVPELVQKFELSQDLNS